MLVQDQRTASAPSSPAAAGRATATAQGGPRPAPGTITQLFFEAARQSTMRVAYSEGEDERTLRAVQTVLDEGIAEPVLIGRREVIEARARAMGLRMDLSESVRVLDPAKDRDEKTTEQVEATGDHVDQDVEQMADPER